MKVHGHLNDDDFAILVEAAAGRLPAAEQRELAEHMGECATCSDAYHWIRSLAGSLEGEVLPSELPDGGASVWARIEANIEMGARSQSVVDDSPALNEDCQVLDNDSQGSTQPWQFWEPNAGSSDLIRQALETDWNPTGIEGIDVRRLSMDAENSTLTMLVRMAAGTSFPAHEHAGAEECFVLEGDLIIDDLVMQAGDFQRMEAGTTHPDQSTAGGCLLMLRSSSRDRLVG